MSVGAKTNVVGNNNVFLVCPVRSCIDKRVCARRSGLRPSMLVTVSVEEAFAEVSVDVCVSFQAT